MRHKICYTNTDIIITSIFITNPNQYGKTTESITARRTRATFLEEWSYGETLQRALNNGWLLNGRESIRDVIQLAQEKLRRQSGGRGSQLAKKREVFKKEVKNYIQQNKDKFWLSDWIDMKVVYDDQVWHRWWVLSYHKKRHEKKIILIDYHFLILFFN